MPLLQNWAVLGILSAFFAALVAILARIGLQNVDATLATTVRSIIMAVVLLGVTLITGKFTLVDGFTVNAWLMIVLSGLAGAASWLCYFLAIQFGGASQAAALDRLSIVFVVVLAGLFLGEPLTLARVAGSVLIVIGALLIAR